MIALNSMLVWLLNCFSRVSTWKREAAHEVFSSGYAHDIEEDDE